ncbi:MAG TPA: hypothetical protein ENJ23_02310 [Bacteroidetes bacterium]|nr:hypothetical protein [Bacteroidota bacterium]
MEHFRNLLFAQATGEARLIETSENYRQRYLEEAKNFSEEDLLRFVQIVSDTEYTIRRSPNPRIRLEMAVIKLIKLDSSVTLEDVIRQLEAQTSPAAPAPAAPATVAEPSAAPRRDAPSAETGQKKSLIPPPPPSSERHPSPNIAAAETPSGTAGEEDSEAPPLSLEVIKQSWDTLTQSIQQRRLFVSVFLKEGEPIAFDGKTLEIGFAKENGFHIEALNRNREIITQALQELFGRSIAVKFVRADIQPKRTVEVYKDDSPGQPQKPQKIDPMVKRILDMFDGELITVGG